MKLLPISFSHYSVAEREKQLFFCVSNIFFARVTGGAPRPFFAENARIPLDSFGAPCYDNKAVSQRYQTIWRDG